MCTILSFSSLFPLHPSPLYSSLSFSIYSLLDRADGEVKARESWREEQYKKRQEELEAGKVSQLFICFLLFSVIYLSFFCSILILSVLLFFCFCFLCIQFICFTFSNFIKFIIFFTFLFFRCIERSRGEREKNKKRNCWPRKQR